MPPRAYLLQVPCVCVVCVCGGDGVEGGCVAHGMERRICTTLCPALYPVSHRCSSVCTRVLCGTVCRRILYGTRCRHRCAAAAACVGMCSSVLSMASRVLSCPRMSSHVLTWCVCLRLHFVCSSRAFLCLSLVLWALVFVHSLASMSSLLRLCPLPPPPLPPSLSRARARSLSHSLTLTLTLTLTHTRPFPLSLALSRSLSRVRVMCINGLLHVGAWYLLHANVSCLVCISRPFHVLVCVCVCVWVCGCVCVCTLSRSVQGWVRSSSRR